MTDEEAPAETDGTAAFAQVSDLADRWHALTDAETTKAKVLLEDASQKLRDDYPDAVAAASPMTLKRIVCAMVKRAMTVGDDMAGISQHSETDGPFNASFTYSNPDGDLYLTKSEKKSLGVGVQKAFHIDLGGE
ncbi:MAG: phage Gp19/Gp15/Gp42 family protein [Bifidobacteriaceae bacterium]|jgi:hypothetical protein|nr:phage Gp19/Gp15/Gp42 family protein [Bifidobacteriaceae bacterium]